MSTQVDKLPMFLEPVKVTCIDPGVTTGYASGIIEDGKLKCATGQAAWNELQMYLQLKLAKPHVLIYERFEMRQGKWQAAAVEMFSRNLIGVMNLYAQEREAQKTEFELVTQMPAQALGKAAYYNDQRLKQDKLYKPGNPHANDALRHLLQWFTFGSGFRFNIQGYEGLA